MIRIAISSPRTRSVPRLAGLMLLLSLTLSACALFRGREQTSGYVDDSAITARVKQALIKDPHMLASAVDVHTVSGRVILSGVVDSAAMASRAQNLAERTPGVRSVQNSLQLANPATTGAAP